MNGYRHRVLSCIMLNSLRPPTIITVSNERHFILTKQNAFLFLKKASSTRWQLILRSTYSVRTSNFLAESDSLYIFANFPPCLFSICYNLGLLNIFLCQVSLNQNKNLHFSCIVIFFYKFQNLMILLPTYHTGNIQSQ